MEYKDIVILAKSLKKQKYCVAGIDINKHEFIRIVSDDESSSYALSKSQMKYTDESEIQILDIARVYFKKHVPLIQQPENWEIDDSKPLEKLGTFEKNDLGNFVTNYKKIFYNTSDRVMIRTYDVDHSFELIKVDELTFNRYRTFYYDYLRDKYDCQFNYKNKSYWLSVTDLDIRKKYKNNYGKHKIKDCYILISLGEEFQSAYYKLVATIIPA